MKEIGYALLAVLLMAGCGLDSGEEKTPAAEGIPAAQEIKVHETRRHQRHCIIKRHRLMGKDTERKRSGWLIRQLMRMEKIIRRFLLRELFLPSIFLLMKGFLLLKRRFPFHLPMYRLIMTWPLLKN